jgi:Lrp/AsnC family transcriptional regulator for asnA, asnC and gidA
MKQKMRQLLSELLKDSKRSDRELAKILKTSQPTVSRMRHTLVKKGVIREFTAIPDPAKLGYEIMAITIAKAKETLTPSEQERAKKLVLDEPRVMYVASAEGMGSNGVMISLHKNYSDFRTFMDQLKYNSEGYITEADSILISLKSGTVIKPLSFSHLAVPEDA